MPSPRATLTDVLRAADAAVVAGDSHAARRFIREALERCAPFADLPGRAEEQDGEVSR